MAAILRKTRPDVDLSHIKDVKQLHKIIQNLLGEVDRLKKIAYYDHLTGLPNRAGFTKLIETAIAQGPEKIRKGKGGKRHFDNKALSVLIIDFDHFKNINDTYGHERGDMVLKKFGEQLRAKKRKTDVAGALGSRWGGEEFVIALPWTSREGAIIYAKKVLEEARKIRIKYFKYATVSIGIATGTMRQSPNKIIERADKALYAAKEAGRDQIKVA